MEMNNLRLLHASMQALGAPMQQFRYAVNHAEFDCLFVANQTPYLLCLTSRGEDPLFLKFKVSPGTFEIPNAMTNDEFRALAKLLRTDGSSGNRLIPKDFLSALDAGIPTVARHRAVAPEDVVRLRPDITEERDKPHFDTWIYWTEIPGASEKNQAKTLALIGDAALLHSIEFKCSSKWSTTPTGRTWVQVARK